jgi:serine/threonine-protein kinase
VPADGGIRFGNYVLLRRIARGGMAEVFLAQQRGLEGFDRRVAVKRILPHLVDSPDFVKMFLGEAKLAAQLTHPNIVHIYDFGKVDQDYFIAMEYVEGIHAGQLFKQSERERMSPTLVARIGADAAAALNYAHELLGPNGRPLGLVHRDVSPANLMISYDGVVKLCDFGIAKAAALTDQRTNPGQVKGKYAYMSPEQTVASSLDGRSDVFSLAVVLWELLAGKTIVPRGDAVAAMRTIRDGKLQPIAQAAPGIPAPLARAITWALATRREDRATAAELATALEAFIKGSPEIATPMQVSAWVRARFPREVPSGPLRAVTSDAAAGPSTVAAPGTVTGTRISSPAPWPTRGATEGGAPRGRLVGRGAPTPMPARAPTSAPAPASRESTEDLTDLTETVAISGDPDAGTETLVVEDKARPASKRLTTREPVIAAHQNATVLEDPSARALDASARAAMDALARDRPSVIIHETLRVPEPAPPLAATPLAATPLAATPLAATYVPHGGSQPFAPAPQPQPFAPAPSLPPQPAPPRWGDSGAHRHPASRSAAGLTGIEVIAHARPPRRLALVGGLAGIAVASFLLALVVCSPERRAAAPRPAGSAAPSPNASAVPQPSGGAPAPDARRRLQRYKVTTRPTGGTVRIGDQRRVAPAELVLPPGKHTVVAELDGWQPETRTIEIVDGADLTQEIAFTRRHVIVREPQPQPQ